jgi:hypothetical protein
MDLEKLTGVFMQLFFAATPKSMRINGWNIWKAHVKTQGRSCSAILKRSVDIIKDVLQRMENADY